MNMVNESKEKTKLSSSVINLEGEGCEKSIDSRLRFFFSFSF